MAEKSRQLELGVAGYVTSIPGMESEVNASAQITVSILYTHGIVLPTVGGSSHLNYPNQENAPQAS